LVRREDCWASSKGVGGDEAGAAFSSAAAGVAAGSLPGLAAAVGVGPGKESGAGREVGAVISLVETASTGNARTTAGSALAGEALPLVEGATGKARRTSGWASPGGGDGVAKGNCADTGVLTHHARPAASKAVRPTPREMKCRVATRRSPRVAKIIENQGADEDPGAPLSAFGDAGLAVAKATFQTLAARQASSTSTMAR
jgi:hypothetical protein